MATAAARRGSGGPGDPDLSWTCHVCGEERPDALIGVYEDFEYLPRGGLVTANVRYCRDRSACFDGAAEIAKSWLPSAISQRQSGDK